MYLPAHPTPDTKTVAERSVVGGGGNAANATVAAARLRGPRDPPVRLLSKVGADAHGDACLAELTRDGVDVRWTLRAPSGHATPASVVLVCGASRTIVHDPGLTLSAPLVPADLDGVLAAAAGRASDTLRPAWLADAALLVLDGRHPLAAAHAATCAATCGVPILLDVERPRPGLDKLMEHATFVVSSADFYAKLRAEDEAAGRPTVVGCGQGDGEDADSSVVAARYVLGRCPRAQWVCVTCGADGCVVLTRGGGENGATTITRVPAWPLPAEGGGVRDTTGAGDAFIGATAVGLRQGLPLQDVLRVASYVAAANVCADGARGGMPTYDALPPELRAKLA